MPRKIPPNSLNSAITDPTAEDFRLLADSARDIAMIFTDPQGGVVRWSAGAQHMLGWQQDEVTDKEPDFFFTSEDRAQGKPEQERETALRDGRAEEGRWYLKKDGTRCWASSVMIPLCEPDGGALRGFAKVLCDHTERKRLEEQTARQHQQERDLARLYRERLEEERRQISRELHDQTGQHLAALGLLLGTLENAALKIREAARHAAVAASNAAQASREAASAAEIAAQVAAVIDAAPDAARLARAASETARTAAITATDAGALAGAADSALAVVDADAPRLAQLRMLIDRLSHDLHRIAVDLRPTSLDDLGLIAAMEALAEEWSQRTGIPAEVAHVGLAGGSQRLPSAVETTLYRVVQEALTNAAKHAPTATRVSITMQRIDRHVQVSVEDDGPGFDPETAGAGRLGLAGMRERATELDGTLEIESAPGSGTTIYMRLPLLPTEPKDS